jgi:hypothetical protein
MRSIPLFAGLLLTVLHTVVNISHAGMMYGLDSRVGNLLTIDPTNGNVLSSRTLGSTEFRGLAGNSRGELYGVTVGSDAQLFRIDPDSAVTTLIGSLGFSSVSGIAFAGHQLFGSDLSGRFFSIDTATGAANPLFSLSGSPFITGLAFGQGAFFAVDSLRDTLIRIESGVATTIGPLGSPPVNALAYDQDGVMFGADSLTGNLLKINESTETPLTLEISMAYLFRA